MRWGTATSTSVAVGAVLAALCGAWVLVILHIQRACLMEEVRRAEAGMAGPIDDETRQAALRVILDETGRCREIIRGPLDCARQEAPRKALVRVEDVVDRAIQVVVEQVGRLGVSVEKRPGADLPDVEVDGAQIHQVLLLGNAMEATVDAGAARPVTVSWGLADDGRVEIEVRDEGTGIAPEHLGRIFEPFCSTRGRKGTGLGLSIAWGIMERHQGDIRVRSEVGKGSVFTLHLPVRTPADAATRPTHDPGNKDGDGEEVSA